MEPDLPGIINLLRTVNPDQITGDKLNCTVNRAVVISKHNPNVHKLPISKTTTDKTTHQFIEPNPSCDIKNKIGLSNNVKKEKLQNELLLLSKIGTSQTVCEKTRRQRNDAIAEILKLSTQHNVCSTTADAPTKEVIKRSVDRVDKWMNGAPETQKKTNILHLGPITFKKKPKSIESNTSINTVSSEGIKINNFCPTNIANDLIQKYTNKKKQAEGASIDSIWSKLEKDLKAKDEEIRKKSSQSSL